MKTIVLSAIMKRYKSLGALYSAMNECEDTVLLNLADDINHSHNEDDILKMIHKTI